MLVLTSIMSFESCGDDEDNNVIVPNNDSYYVKYEASTYCGNKVWATFKVCFTTEKEIKKL